jgi:hypothetical protein
MNGDVTLNSELNMDDSSKQQSESGADGAHSGPNYAYIVRGSSFATQFCFNSIFSFELTFR